MYAIFVIVLFLEISDGCKFCTFRDRNFKLSGNAQPRAGFGVVRIDPLRFLAGCRTRRLNQVYFLFYMVSLFIRAPFYVLLVFIAMCAVFWLFWLSYQFLPSDWLERLVCVPILLCFHSFVFPWAVESSPLQFLALA